MNAKTAKTVGKAMADIRAALRSATDEEKSAIAASLRDLLVKADGGPVAAPAPAKRTSAPTAEEIQATAKRLVAEGKAWTSGSVKVFICDVYEALNLAMSLRDFKATLPEMQRTGAVLMSRADLAEVMDPAKVAASEVLHLSASFHFIRGE